MKKQLTDYLYPTSTSYDTLSSGMAFASRRSVTYQTSTASETATYNAISALRIGAFNIRVFGQKKVANEDTLNILVQVVVISSDSYYIIVIIITVTNFKFL